MGVKPTICILSGGFDPIHSGHLAMFLEAKSRYTKVVVGVNSDDWLTRKKGKPFMPLSERLNIIRNIKSVDVAIAFDDSDGSACSLISNVVSMYGDDYSYIFANGGDRTASNIPEMMHTYDRPISFEFGIGGADKANSSSWILESWSSEKAPEVTERDWGTYEVIKDYKTCKVKELIVQPNRSLSYQVHKNRSEYWYVREGRGTAIIGHDAVELLPGQMYNVPATTWHQLINGTNKPLSIIEIQFGSECVEEDIVRA